MQLNIKISPRKNIIVTSTEVIDAKSLKPLSLTALFAKDYSYLTLADLTKLVAYVEATTIPDVYLDQMFDYELQCYPYTLDEAKLWLDTMDSTGYSYEAIWDIQNNIANHSPFDPNQYDFFPNQAKALSTLSKIYSFNILAMLTSNSYDLIEILALHNQGVLHIADSYEAFAKQLFEEFGYSLPFETFLADLEVEYKLIGEEVDGKVVILHKI